MSPWNQPQIIPFHPPYYFFLILFIYLWLCWVFVSVRGLSLVAASGGHSSSRCAGLSLSWPLLLRSTGSRHAGSVVVAHGPSRSAACGIFPDQGSNPCPLHWQADSQPLRHQGSPYYYYYYYWVFLGIEKSFSWAKVRTLAQKTVSRITLRNCSGEAWFRLRTKNIKRVRNTFLEGFKKKQASTYTASHYGLGTWEGNLIMEGVPALAFQEGRHLIFIFNMDIL